MTSLIRKIVRACGGPSNIAAATALNDKPITRTAVQKWLVPGGTIPEHHWSTLLQLSAARDQALDVEDLFAANKAARLAGKATAPKKGAAHAA
jgi:hypothetical protein